MTPFTEAVLILCSSDPNRDPRPRRMIEFCSDQGTDVYVLGSTEGPDTETLRFFSVGQRPLRIKRQFRRGISSLLLKFAFAKSMKLALINWRHGLRMRDECANIEWSRIIVHDLDLLPLAFEVSKAVPVYFDAREFYPSQNTESLFFRIFEMQTREWLCQSFLPRCRAVMTVSEGLRKCYRESFSIDPIVIRSVPHHRSFYANPSARKRIRLVHHGIANANRSLPQLIRMTELLDQRFTLDLYLTGKKSAIAGLKNLSAQYKNVNILPPVQFEEIIPTLNKYDMGIAFFPPTTLNLKYCLPNKFFEFVQARIALAVGPSPDMASLVKKYNIGFVTEDFEFSSLAHQLNLLTEKSLNQAKERCNSAAVELCFEIEKKRISKMWRDNE